MKRRDFFRCGILSTAAVSGLAAQATEKTSENVLSEPAKKIPVAGRYDVIVCGGGPAGVAAALSSARAGAKTLLLESHGCLGGIWTAGIMPWILDHNQPGIMEELKTKIEARGGRCPISTHSYSFDPEILKRLLEELCDEAKIDFLLHTQIVGTAKSSATALSHVVTESKSGRLAWAGKVFIDCTGDGDVAALSGCGFDVGNRDGDLQPGTLNALIDGIRYEELKDYIRSNADVKSASKGRLLELIRKQGVEPSYKSPAIYPIRDDLFWVMFNHAYGLRFDDARSLTRHTVEARRELHRIIEALRSAGGAWKNLRLVGTAEQIGIREARRIHGLYTVTVDEILNGARHEDTVCRVRFGLDVHALAIDKAHGGNRPSGKAKPYDIPIRSLISKDVSNLMMAGRCISGDFFAHSSYRVTGPATMLGEAAGDVAARAAKEDTVPKNVAFKSKYF